MDKSKREELLDRIREASQTLFKCADLELRELRLIEKELVEMGALEGEVLLQTKPLPSGSVNRMLMEVYFGFYRMKHPNRKWGLGVKERRMNTPDTGQAVMLEETVLNPEQANIEIRHLAFLKIDRLLEVIAEKAEAMAKESVAAE